LKPSLNDRPPDTLSGVATGDAAAFCPEAATDAILQLAKNLRRDFHDQIPADQEYNPYRP
jgi:hypothetical protein